MQSMVVINEEKAKKLPAGDTTIVVQCGNKANHKANFIVKNTLPTLAKPFAVLESVHDFSGFKVKLNRPGSEVLNENMPVKFWISLLVDGENYFLTDKRGAYGHWVRSDGDDSELKHLVFTTQMAKNQSHEFLVDFDLGKKWSPSIAGLLKYPETGKVSPELLIADSIFYAAGQKPNGKIEKVLIGYQVGLDEVKVVETNWKNSSGIISESLYYEANRKYAFETLNKVRAIIGVGYLKQNSALDNAAQAHAEYFKLNPTEGGHTEKPGYAGFTGVNPKDRAKHFGYKGGDAGESIGPGYTSMNALMYLLGVPYHSRHLIGAANDIGIGWLPNLVGGIYGIMPVVTDYLSQNSQAPASDFVAVFPCNNIQVNVQYQGNESPNPAVLNGKKDFGYNSIAVVKKGQKIEVASWEMRDDSGNIIPTVVMTKDNDSNGYFSSHEAALIPLDKLPLTTANYTTTIKGKNNGISFEKNCKWGSVSGDTIPQN